MLTGKGNAKQTADQLPKIKSADQGLMIRSSVPEEPTGETDCSTYVLSQDNKIKNNVNKRESWYKFKGPF